MSRTDIVNNRSEQAMARAQERAKSFISVPTFQKSIQVGTYDNNLTPIYKEGSESPKVKSSLKLRPGLQRAVSEPSRKSVHFSTTNLVDVRQFKRSQSPKSVGLHIDSPKFPHTGSKVTMNLGDSDSESDDDDDDDDEEEYEDEDSSDDGCKISASYGLDEEEFDEDGISRIPKLKLRTRRANGTKEPEDKSKQRHLSGWTLLTPGFVPHSKGRISGEFRPVAYLESLQFIDKSMEIKASVFVRNLAFDKFVAVRYTLNNWSSYSECQGDWSDDIRKFDRENHYDRFIVTLPLNLYSPELLNTSTISLCVRYFSNGKEFWDNNNGKNYQLLLRNQKLPSASSIAVENQAALARSALQPLKVTKPVLLRRNSDPLMGTKKQQDSSVSQNFKLPAQDKLPTKKNVNASPKDPFGSRYSFGVSYNINDFSREGAALSSQLSRNASAIPVNEYNSFDEPVSIKANQETRKPETKVDAYSYRNSHATGDDATSAWESQTYKDFVSKYCFYTPQENINTSSDKSNTTTSSAATTTAVTSSQ